MSPSYFAPVKIGLFMHSYIETKYKLSLELELNTYKQFCVEDKKQPQCLPNFGEIRTFRYVTRPVILTSHVTDEFKTLSSANWIVC